MSSQIISCKYRRKITLFLNTKINKFALKSHAFPHPEKFRTLNETINNDLL